MDQIGHNVITHPVTETHSGKKILSIHRSGCTTFLLFPFVLCFTFVYTAALCFCVLGPLSKITIPPEALRRGIKVFLNIVNEVKI